MPFTMQQTRFGQILTLISVQYHRNGTSGRGFLVVGFCDSQYPTGQMLGFIPSPPGDDEAVLDEATICVIDRTNLNMSFRNEFYGEPLARWYHELQEDWQMVDLPWPATAPPRRTWTVSPPGH